MRHNASLVCKCDLRLSWWCLHGSSNAIWHLLPLVQRCLAELHVYSQSFDARVCVSKFWSGDFVFCRRCSSVESGWCFGCRHALGVKRVCALYEKEIVCALYLLMFVIGSVRYLLAVVWFGSTTYCTVCLISWLDKGCPGTIWVCMFSLLCMYTCIVYDVWDVVVSCMVMHCSCSIMLI